MEAKPTSPCRASHHSACACANRRSACFPKLQRLISDQDFVYKLHTNSAQNRHKAGTKQAQSAQIQHKLNTNTSQTQHKQRTISSMNHLDQVTQAVRRAIGAGLPSTTAIFAAARSEIRAAKISGYRHRQINSAIEEAGLKISETYYRRLYSSDRIQKKS